MQCPGVVVADEAVLVIDDVILLTNKTHGKHQKY